MTLVAKLKALLHLDSTQYKEGLRDASGQTVAFKRELRGTNDEISKTSKLSSGLAAIMQGNFVRGIKLVTQGFMGMNSALVGVVGRLGIIGASIGLLWQAGKAIGGFFGKRETEAAEDFDKRVKEQVRRMEREIKRLKAEREKEEKLRAAREKEETNVRGIAKEIQDDRIKRLQGREAIEAKFAQRMEEIDQKRMATTSAREKAYLDMKYQETIKSYQAELAEFNKKEKEEAETKLQKYMEVKEKISKAEQDAMDKHAEINRQAEERSASIRGRGVSVDAMARTGGFVGQQRSYVAIADRQMSVQKELAETTRDLVKVDNELRAEVGSLREELKRLQGGGLD